MVVSLFSLPPKARHGCPSLRPSLERGWVERRAAHTWGTAVPALDLCSRSLETTHVRDVRTPVVHVDLAPYPLSRPALRRSGSPLPVVHPLGVALAQPGIASLTNLHE